MISANQTILPTYPVGITHANGTVSVSQRESVLYESLAGTLRNADGSLLFPTLPLDGSKRSIISVPYLCHFSERKSAGEAFIAVLVATLSMFSAGWAIFMLVCSYLAKRGQPQGAFSPGASLPFPVYSSVLIPCHILYLANCCDYHSAFPGPQYQQVHRPSTVANMGPTTPGLTQKLAYQ